MGNLMDNAQLSVLRASVRNHAIPNDRDKLLKSNLVEMLENVEDIRNGGGSRMRSLFVIGNSGCGKSFSLRKLFAEMSELQPYQDELGVCKRPLVSVEAPRPCGLVELTNVVLSELGYPENHSMKPGFAMSLLKQILRENGVIILHIDEAQHLLRHQTPEAVKKMQDQLKSLVQTEEWPLHTIYSGVHELSALLGTKDRQVNNRCYIRRMPSLSAPDELPIVKSVVETVAVELCGLRVDMKILSEEFLWRICHASVDEFGTVIETVQETSFMALKNGHSVLEERHFERYFERRTACLAQDNVFTIKSWRSVNVRSLLSDMAEGKGRSGR